MISIDRQPWAHRGGPAFVTSKLNPIADPHRTLMNWPCSPSLFNWWRVLFQVHHHYVPRTHWFSKKHPHRSSYFFSLFSVSTLLHTIIAPWLALNSITRGISFSLHFTAHVVFKKWICKSEVCPLWSRFAKLHPHKDPQNRFLGVYTLDRECRTY